MSIKQCEKHGKWNSAISEECPKCILYSGVWEGEEVIRKTFFGMTPVGWFVFSYISAVIIAIALIVI